MLYPKNEFPFQEAQFQNPDSEYRGTPFWAWNCYMTKEKISMMIDTLKTMGMGGGHIHCRTGLDNPYMGEEFLDLVEDSNKKLKKEKMLTWLYDEDRWPSGSGGGMVTKNEKYRIRFLVFSPCRLEKNQTGSKVTSTGQAVRSDKRRLLSRYEVLIRDGWLIDYHRLSEAEVPQSGYDEWFAYLEISGENPWFNNQAYVNTLDKKAIQCFIEVTHEKYKEKLGAEFGKSIPAIFTDEPQFCHKTRLCYAEDKTEVIIPYTDDFDETFTEAYGHDFLSYLPELFWEKGENCVSEIRYQYHDHVCERFVSAFADTLGNWCRQNGLMLTGHMMDEPTLESQTAALGEAMRSYRAFQLPGIDMLCDRRELSTAKQAQSAARQFGCPSVLSEMYGVTNWDFDFRGHKLQGDWQAALGVTVRVHHLTWTSMGGEAKRDYPAAIGYQSPWYREYYYVEDYFARINTLLTRGKAVVKIGVIHPIESYWLYWGCEEKTSGIRKEMEQNFEKVIEWLLYGFLDFDFICESLLPNQNSIEQINGEIFPVGDMRYEAILVPNCETLRTTTFKRLKAFYKKGGSVLFTGNTPKYLDGKYSKEMEDFVKVCEYVPFTRTKLLNKLENRRVLDVKNENGMRADNLIYQMREDNEEKIIFLAHVNKMENPDVPVRENNTITIQGVYRVICYNPLDGTKTELALEYYDGKTIIRKEMYNHDSLLLRLCPAEAVEYQKKLMPVIPEREKTEALKRIEIPEKVPVVLSEPNVLVFDQAEYIFDQGPWQKKEEILRIDNKFRKVLGYPLRMEAFAQPWLDQDAEPLKHWLFLRFKFLSMADIAGAKLALENREAEVWLNGSMVQSRVNGWYVDQDIICRELGIISRGENELIVKIPYRKKENIEAMFLLGDFGVQTAGAESILTAPVRKLAYADITRQGLPFYGGNIQYHIPFQLEKRQKILVEVSRFRAPLLKVQIDEGRKQAVAYAPYQVKTEIEEGEHVLKLTVFGNRINTFGTLHNCNETERWYGPNAWRTEGTCWACEYQLEPSGILKAPLLYVCD